MAHTDPCTTCAMIQGILMSRGVSTSTAGREESQAESRQIPEGLRQETEGAQEEAPSIRSIGTDEEGSQTN